MYVYVDLFLGLNIALNTCILVLTAKLCGVGIRWLRILAAAAIGGMYALVALYYAWPSALMDSAPVKFLVSLLLIRIAFIPGSLCSLLQKTAAYYIACFVIGGSVAGFHYFHQTLTTSLFQPIRSSLGWSDLLAGTVIAFSLLLAVKSGFLINLFYRSIEYHVDIEFQGKYVTATAMLDTGNALYSLSRKPVIIVEHQALQALFSLQTQAFLADYVNEAWVENLHQCEDKAWLARMQLIPFRALSGNNMLVAFRPDTVRVRSMNGVIETTDVVIGIYAGRLSANRQYAALLHPAILNLTVHEEVKTCVSPG